ncbi:MAG: NifB/NifX family molybdenum-iron cluster-binding protein [Bacteroidales bacterium]|nr:NifB/NifX family molybdenum-iron cluster-binding protein [Bacteroidales bacterium]
MRVAIASTGNTLDSNICQQFGRCEYFIIYDTESKATEFIPNPFKDLAEGSGQAALKLVTSRKVSKIISGDFGIKIKPTIDRLKIQMIVLKDVEKKINDIIDMLNH